MSKKKKKASTPNPVPTDREGPVADDENSSSGSLEHSNEAERTAVEENALNTDQVDSDQVDSDEVEESEVDSDELEESVAEPTLMGLVMDTCLIIAALVACLAAFAPRPRGLDAHVPVVLEFDEAASDVELTLRIDDRNRLSVQQEPLDSYQTLRDFLASRRLRPRVVQVVASQDSLARTLMDTVQALRERGVARIHVSTSPF